MISALPPMGHSSNANVEANVEAIAPLSGPLPILPECIDDLPNLCGWETELRHIRQQQQPVFLPHTSLKLDQLSATFAVALHMHQPMVPVGDGGLVNYLQHMFEHPFEGDNHRAGTFIYCYSRIADFIIDLVNQGYSPRVMLNYSGTLLWGLRQMGRGDVLDKLKRMTTEPAYFPHVEWLGTFWGHAIAATLPPADFQLHIQAWQHHFAAMFGWEALGRVRGFCLPELTLPSHPDTLFTLVQTLKATGYRWLLARADQLRTANGQAIAQPHLPHRLLVTNTQGEQTSITVLLHTTSPTGGVAQMAPYQRSRHLQPQPFATGQIPPLVLQMEDGENSHAMMHDFPGAYRNTWYDVLHHRDRPIAGVTGTEYLELIEAHGMEPERYPACEVCPAPLPSLSPAVKNAQARLHQRLQAAHAAALSLAPTVPFTQQSRYRAALVHYLVAQTSCFQHWSDKKWHTYWQTLYQRADGLLRQGF